MQLLLVAIGGATGAVGRYLLGNFIAKVCGNNLPYGTFVINIIGCFCMGCLMTLFTEKQLLSSGGRLLLCVGFLGGFTTFSSFGYETFSLINSGKVVEAMGYAGGSVVVGLVAAFLGVYLGRML